MESSLRAPLPPVLYSLGYSEGADAVPSAGIHVPFFSPDLGPADLDPADDSDNASKVDSGRTFAPADVVPKQKRKKSASKRGDALAKAEPAVDMVDFSSDAYFGDIFTDLMMPGSDDPFMADDSLFLDGGDDLNLPGISPMSTAVPLHLKGVVPLQTNKFQSNKLAAKATDILVKGSTDDAKKLFVDEDWFDGVDTSWAVMGSQTPRRTDDGGKHLGFFPADTNKATFIKIDEDDLKLIIGAVPRSAKKARALVHVSKKRNELGGTMVPTVDARRCETPDDDNGKRAYRRKSAAINGTAAALASTDMLSKMDPQMLELLRRRGQSRTRTISTDSGGDLLFRARSVSGDSSASTALNKPKGKAKNGKRGGNTSSSAGGSVPVGMGSSDGYLYPVPGGAPIGAASVLAAAPNSLKNDALNGSVVSSGRNTPVSRKHGSFASSKATSLRYKNTKTLESLNRTFWRYENMRSLSAERLKVETVYPKSNHAANKKHTGQIQTTVAPAFPFIFSASRHPLTFGVHGDDLRRLKAMFPRYCGDLSGDAKISVPYSSQITVPVQAVGTNHNISGVVLSIGSAMTVISHSTVASGGAITVDRPQSSMDDVKKEPHVENAELQCSPNKADVDIIIAKTELVDVHTPGSKEDLGVTTTCSSAGSSDNAEADEAGQKYSPGGRSTTPIFQNASKQFDSSNASLSVPATVGGNTNLRSYISPLLMATRAMDVEDAMNQSYAKYDCHSSVVAPEMVMAKATLDGFRAMCDAAKSAFNDQTGIDWAALTAFNVNQGPLALARSANYIKNDELHAGNVNTAAVQKQDADDALKDPTVSLYESQLTVKPTTCRPKVLRSSSADPYISSTRFLYSAKNNSKMSALDRSMLSQLMPYMTDDSDTYYAVTTKSARVYDSKNFAEASNVDILGSVHTSIGQTFFGNNGHVDTQQLYPKKGAAKSAVPLSLGDTTPIGKGKKRSRAKVVSDSVDNNIQINDNTVALLASKGIQGPQFKVVSQGIQHTSKSIIGNSISDKVVIAKNAAYAPQMIAADRGNIPAPIDMMRSSSMDSSIGNAQLQQHKWEAQYKAAGIPVPQNISVRSDVSSNPGLNRSSMASAQKNGSSDDAAYIESHQPCNINSSDNSTVKKRKMDQESSVALIGSFRSGNTDVRGVDANRQSSFKNFEGLKDGYGDLSLSSNGSLLGNLNFLPSMSLPTSGSTEGMAIRSLSTMPHLNVAAHAGLNNLLLPSLPLSSAANGMSWFTPQWPPSASASSAGLSKPMVPARSSSEPHIPQTASTLSVASRQLDLPSNTINVSPSLSSANSGTNYMPSVNSQLQSPSRSTPANGLLLSRVSQQSAVNDNSTTL